MTSLCVPYAMNVSNCLKPNPFYRNIATLVLEGENVKNGEDVVQWDFVHPPKSGGYLESSAEIAPSHAQELLCLFVYST